jgi:tetratricopeptide (TPR) repeat protein
MNQINKSSNNRQIRVYVSSNFSDMCKERGILMNEVFPQIRELCNKHAVTFTEVDLRQGMSNEADAEDKVLQLFSEEIDRCRPFFIGLLGENYGWVPESIPPELLERKPWLRDCGGRSVIELENLHALNNLEMGSQDFFYFRDPSWIEKLPPDALHSDFVSKDAASAEKLRQLKKRIRGSGLPVRENYPTPETLGELVLADIKRVVDSLFPIDSPPDPIVMSKESETLATSGDLAGAMALLKEQERMCLQSGDLNSLSITIGSQAKILSERGDLINAIARLREQEQICRQLGDPISLSISLSSQANVLFALGNLDEAMTLCEEVELIIRQELAASDRVLGPEHPDNLGILNNLATMLANKGDYASAESLFRRVLEARERVLGHEHPNTLESINNLAELLEKRGDCLSAELLCQQALCVSEQIFGQRHLATLTSVNNLARLLSRKGDFFAEAESLVRESDNDDALHSKKQPSHRMGRSEAPTRRIDKVHFSVASPPGAQLGQKIIIDIWAHLEQQRAEVNNRVQQARIPTEAPPVIRPKGPFKIERGTILFVRLKFQDLIVEPDEDVILWEGEIGNASFVVSVPAEISKGMRIGSVSVHCEGGFQIARIPLQLLIADEVVHSEPIEQTLHRVRKAFVSYARNDLDEVLSRIQGMQKIMPDLDVFLDVVKLRSGEDWEKRLWNVIPESDVFYLFWSAAAKESIWVEKEWRCALSSRGVDFIDPVPLVSPEEVPPPEELSKMHFNDWSFAYKRGKSNFS